MSFMSDENPYQSGFSADAHSAALADEWARTTFIRRTYMHLAGAIGLFVLIETMIFSLVPEAQLSNMLRWMMGGRWNWLLVLGAFMIVGTIANNMAASARSLSTQYFGLGLYVLAESVIFVPLLFIAQHFAPGAIPAAGIMTAVVFSGLTALVLVTKANFSWLGRYLALCGFAAIGLIICAAFFQGFNLGMWFSGAMVVLAGGYILYGTSNVLHRFGTDQYVAAALALFASVALLFWYILQIMISLRGRN